MNYKHTLNYYNKTIDDKWKHTKTENMGIVKQANVDLAISKETLAFFKRIGSKERVQKSHNAVRLTSISPNGKEKRVHIYEKIGE